MQKTGYQSLSFVVFRIVLYLPFGCTLSNNRCRSQLCSPRLRGREEGEAFVLEVTRKKNEIVTEFRKKKARKKQLEDTSKERKDIYNEGKGRGRRGRDVKETNKNEKERLIRSPNVSFPSPFSAHDATRTTSTFSIIQIVLVPLASPSITLPPLSLFSSNP